LLNWKTGVFTDGWDLGVVQLVVQVVVKVDTLILLNITVQVRWSVESLITTGDEWVVDLTSLPADGVDVTDVLVDLWGDVLLLDQFLEELFADELLTVDNGLNELLTDWEDLVNDLLPLDWEDLLPLDWEDLLSFDWEDLFVNLNINDPWLIDNNAFSGDWGNDNLLLWENLNISLNFSDWLNDGLTLEQVPVDALEEELVVDSLSVGWVVLLSVDGLSGLWKPVCGVSVVNIFLLLSVNVWQDIPVPHDQILEGLTSQNILSVSALLLATDGWESVLVLEKLNNGVDVLVEEDWVDEVLTEGGDLPETLEVDGGNVPLEDWVLDVLTEEGDAQVFTEELGVVDLFEGEDLVNVVDSLEDILSLDEVPLSLEEVLSSDEVLSLDEVPLSLDKILSLDEVPLLFYWHNAFEISDDRLFEWETLNNSAQLLLQQQIVNDWALVQQRSLSD